MNPSGANSNQRPLSYDDLLRWLVIVALLSLGIALAIAIKETLLLFAIAFLIAMVLNPGVAWLERRGLNRGVAVVLLVAVLLVILVLGAFLGEFVPIIGPVIVAIPALFVAASMGFAKFGLALLAILFVQQVQSNLLLPLVMGKQMNLHAVTINFLLCFLRTEQSGTLRLRRASQYSFERPFFFFTGGGGAGTGSASSEG
jgi:predicted PurR-regulated permease PerM